MLRKELSEFKNKGLLNALVAEIQKNASYNFCTNDFERSIYSQPSTVDNYIINFILHNIELNEYKNLYTQDSFEKSFNELIKFMKKTEIEYEIYYPLHGCIGNDELIVLNELSIKKASLQDCNFFDTYYNFETPHSIFKTDLKIGDYFLILKRSCSKKDLQVESLRNSTKASNIVYLLLLLSANGNIKLGRGINKYVDWTVHSTYASHLKSEPMNFTKDLFTYSIDGLKNKLEENSTWILSDKFKLDNSLEHSLNWLRKAKQTTDLNDKIVQLSLALEFSIKTDRNSISKDLREKSAVLYTYDGTHSYKKSKETIYNFYDLRSKIVHGSEEIITSNETTTLMDNAEKIIRENLLLLCKLNQKFSFEQIDLFTEEARCTTPRPTLKSIIEK